MALANILKIQRHDDYLVMLKVQLSSFLYLMTHYDFGSQIHDRVYTLNRKLSFQSICLCAAVRPFVFWSRRDFLKKPLPKPARIKRYCTLKMHIFSIRIDRSSRARGFQTWMLCFCCIVWLGSTLLTCDTLCICAYFQGIPVALDKHILGFDTGGESCFSLCRSTGSAQWCQSVCLDLFKRKMMSVRGPQPCRTCEE